MSDDGIRGIGGNSAVGRRPVSPMDDAAQFSPEALPAQPSPAQRHDVVIETWFVECIHNSPAARNTEIFNYVRAAVDDLKRRLRLSSPNRPA